MFTYSAQSLVQQWTQAHTRILQSCLVKLPWNDMGALRRSLSADSALPLTKTRVSLSTLYQCCPEMPKLQMSTVREVTTWSFALAHRPSRAWFTTRPLCTVGGLLSEEGRCRVYHTVDRELHVVRAPRNQKFKIMLTPRRQAAWL